MRDFEVFVRHKPGEPLKHVGSVRSSDPESAAEAGIHIYLRRDPFERVWIVAREHVWEVVGEPEFERRRLEETEYRRPGFFTRRLLSVGYRPPKLELGKAE